MLRPPRAHEPLTIQRELSEAVNASIGTLVALRRVKKNDRKRRSWHRAVSGSGSPSGPGVMAQFDMALDAAAIAKAVIALREFGVEAGQALLSRVPAQPAAPSADDGWYFGSRRAPSPSNFMRDTSKIAASVRSAWVVSCTGM